MTINVAYPDKFSDTSKIDITNQTLLKANKLIESHDIQRDIITTRYAGLYSDFSKKQEMELNQQNTDEISDTTDKTKKNRLFSFIAKYTN